MPEPRQVPEAPVLVPTAYRLVTADDVASIRSWIAAHPAESRQAPAPHLCQV